MFLHDVTRAFALGTLELDCPEMTVRQDGVAAPIVHSGPGLIRQNPDRGIEFRLFCTAKDGLPPRCDPFHPEGDVEAGRLIPTHHYYSLQAIDQHGREWVSRRVTLERDFGKGLVVSGTLPSITHTDDAATPNRQGFMLRVRGEVAVPVNLYTSETRLAGDEQVARSRRLDAAKFDAHGCGFLIRREDGWLVVRVDAAGTELPAHAETRVIEALQFVLGRSMWWAVMVRFTAAAATTCLRSERPRGADPQLPPPINFEAEPPNGAVWPLFGRYLAHVWHYPGDRFHTTSAWLNMARAARGGSVFSAGLALGVAIEGVLRTEYATVVQPDPALAEQVAAARAYVTAWGGDERLKRRLVGAIGAMHHVGAKDRLHALRDAGVVTRAQLDAWGRLRNSATHARPPEDDELQSWLDLCYVGTVLLYHLIFAAIGYAGGYTDYAAPHWPLARYNGRLSEAAGREPDRDETGVP